MFNIKYNIVNLVKVLLSVLNMVLMLRVFNFSQESDLYLLAYSIIYTFNFIPLLFIGQFIQFYNDLKAKSTASAHDFYNQSIVFTALLGIGLFGLSYIFLQSLLHLHTLSIDVERLVLLTRLMRIMVFCVLFLPLLALLERIFTAEKQFFMLYVCQIIMVLLPVLSLGYMLLTHQANIILLAESYTVSVVLAVVLGLGTVAVRTIPFRFSWPSSSLIPFIKNSFSTHSGIAMTNCFMPIILNNFLVHFPNGIISCFYYSRNALEATHTVTTDYSIRLFLAEVSAHIAQNNLSRITPLIKKYLLYVPVCFAIISLCLYAAIPLGLKIVFMHMNLAVDVSLFKTLFLYLIPWFVLSLVSHPYYAVNLSAKNSRSIIAANLFFVLTLWGTLYFCYKNIYYIAWALFLAQGAYFLICLFFYVRWRKQCRPKSV